MGRGEGGDDGQGLNSSDGRRTLVHIMDDEFLNDYCKAVKVHPQVCQYAQTITKLFYDVTEISHYTTSGPTFLIIQAEVGPVTGRCDISVV